MGTVALPLRQHSRHQEDLIWWATESDGALGRRSIQGAIQSRLEGGSGVHEGHDLLEHPQEALEDIIHRTSFKAAGRIRNIEKAWKLLRAEDQQILAAVYWTPVHRGLDAFGALANLVVLSKIARERHLSARTKMTFGEWVTRLSDRRVGTLQKGGGRSPGKASSSEIVAVRAINWQCERMLTEALENYVESVRRVGQ